jgi:hypothetical protein
MKSIKPLSLFLFLALFSMAAVAQRIKLTEGSLSGLKNENKIYFEFRYDDMKVGKFEKEADYISDKTADLNKKEAGRGDSWSKAWVNDRAEHFEPKFKELFAKSSEMAVEPSAKYTLIFHTTFTEPGFNVGVWRKNAEINGEAWIVETADKSKPIAKISLQKALGRTFGGYDFDTGVRISEAYADAGKALGKFIRNEAN